MSKFSGNIGYIYNLNMKCDLAKLSCKSYDVVNGNIDEHLNAVACYLKSYPDKRNGIIGRLFKELFHEYRNAFYRKTEVEPGSYIHWCYIETLIDLHKDEKENYENDVL